MEESESNQIDLLLIDNLKKDEAIVSTESLIKTFLIKLIHIKNRISCIPIDIIDQIKIYAKYRINVSKIFFKII